MEQPAVEKPRHAGLIALTLVAVAVSVCAAISIGSFAVWREWPWSSYPSRLHYCGRVYLGPGVADSQTDIQARGAHKIGDVPDWFNLGEVWAVYSPSQGLGGCGTEVWVHSTSGGFRGYVLNGGPDTLVAPH